MGQTEARTVARKIHEHHPDVIAVAITDTRFRGDWDTDRSIWGVAIGERFYREIDQLPERYL